ncbi:MAG: MFS transporter [Eggerthellaceae bacterium]|jgi:MFS family permease
MTEEKSAPLLSVIAFGLVACVLYGLGAGLRGDIGILLQPLATQCNASYADVSFCIAVMQITFGAAQPVFGMIASRRSNRFVLVLGAGIVAASLVGMALSRSFAALLLTLGFGFGIGVGALGFGLILTSAINYVGPDRAMIISGMLNAAAGMLGFILSPLIQWMLSTFGTVLTLLLLLIPTVALVPIAFVVTSRDADRKRELADGREKAASAGSGKPVGTMSVADIRDALHNRTFLLLVAGFSTCGFHMVIIESHLFNQYVLYGIDAAAAAWAFSVYGIATILGALLSGWLSTRVRKGHLLGFYYGFRAVWVAAFLVLMPKTLPFAVLFAIGLGLTGDATVSPTSGLVSDTFSLHKVATLIGVLFFCHQIGAFLSAWFGGVILDATGAYDLIWIIDIAVCAFACIMSLRIREDASQIRG